MLPPSRPARFFGQDLTNRDLPYYPSHHRSHSQHYQQPALSKSPLSLLPSYLNQQVAPFPQSSIPANNKENQYYLDISANAVTHGQPHLRHQKQQSMLGLACND